MPLQHHISADAWFESQFGVKYRSQALFVTGSWAAARLYAASDKHVVRIIPILPYRFCWSRSLRDLLEFFVSGAVSGNIGDFLTQNNYSESDLEGAHASGHEVMLHCLNYIAIPVEAPRQLQAATIMVSV
jgi:hypothetical protein